jgi:thymidylate synthase ThyX
MAMVYTPEQEAVLKKYFSNTDQDTFALINLPEVVKGTLFSRYSRSAKDLRTLFLEEFYGEASLQGVFAEEHHAGTTAVDVNRAEDFYERVLVGYGDDSVAELGGAHVAVENISMLATKSIEEHRLGLSPLERSTRYVYFDKKVDGEYAFVKEPRIMASKYRDLYLDVNNTLFEAYATIVRDIQPLLKKIFPGDENEKAYNASIRAKACDLGRWLLPLSAKTSMGVFGNGRALEYLLTTLLGDPLQEVREMGKSMDQSLRQVIPAFVKRATNERGNAYRSYLVGTERGLAPLAQNLAPTPVAGEGVTLVEWDADAVEKILAAAYYERNSCSFAEAREAVNRMSPREKEWALAAAVSHRQHRTNKPPRFFEETYFGFDVVADWGVYKDLQRHRILTRYKQRFTNELGYVMPEEMALTGFEKRYRDAMDRAIEGYEALKQAFPNEAQYVVTHGAYNRFYMKLNLRALLHMAELRSAPQGHPTYRLVAQQMATAVAEKLPLLGKHVFRFVDYNDYDLERLEAFRRLEKKADAVGIQAFQDE